MDISYDVFTAAFLRKISEYELLSLRDETRTDIVDGYMKSALNKFKKVCKHDFFAADNGPALRTFTLDISEDELIEIADIVSDGMVVCWLKPYVYQQELLQNVISSKDYTQYSPSELLMRVGNAYDKASKEFTRAVKDYSYDHGDLTALHL